MLTSNSKRKKKKKEGRKLLKILRILLNKDITNWRDVINKFYHHKKWIYELLIF